MFWWGKKKEDRPVVGSDMPPKETPRVTPATEEIQDAFNKANEELAGAQKQFKDLLDSIGYNTNLIAANQTSITYLSQAITTIAERQQAIEKRLQNIEDMLAVNLVKFNKPTSLS